MQLRRGHLELDAHDFALIRDALVPPSRAVDIPPG
jgi:hypothetical protein